MTIRYLKKHAALEGHVAVDDAEALAQWLLKQPSPAVHLGKCEHLHAAVLQVLLALRPRLVKPPTDALLAGVLAGVQAGVQADDRSNDRTTQLKVGHRSDSGLSASDR
ncbi:hypothetical protein [Leptothrix discophora]|uniref:Uncharacterized protein n=1 Tax=Leptothrix discophora TaxID=89 RepID=A0ABT9G1S3_LEPDI|nr:hypothetical protein [Leptothrix discophora]MDP4300439.1 hypothetical protein [Leptothrix discophora]